MPNHRADDGALPPDDQPPYVPTPVDELRRLRYTLFPTLYVDDDSTVNDLLYQLVLEQRATRWLTALLGTAVVTLLIIIFVTVAAT